MDAQTKTLLFSFLMTSGMVLVFLVWLLQVSQGARSLLGRFVSWLNAPSEAKCKKISARMLDEMARNIADRKAKRK